MAEKFQIFSLTLYSVTREKKLGDFNVHAKNAFMNLSSVRGIYRGNKSVFSRILSAALNPIFVSFTKTFVVGGKIVVAKSYRFRAHDLMAT